MGLSRVACAEAAARRLAFRWPSGRKRSCGIGGGKGGGGREFDTNCGVDRDDVIDVYPPVAGGAAGGASGLGASEGFGLEVTCDDVGEPSDSPRAASSPPAVRGLGLRFSQGTVGLLGKGIEGDRVIALFPAGLPDSSADAPSFAEPGGFAPLTARTFLAAGTVESSDFQLPGNAGSGGGASANRAESGLEAAQCSLEDSLLSVAGSEDRCR